MRGPHDFYKQMMKKISTQKKRISAKGSFTQMCDVESVVTNRQEKKIPFRYFPSLRKLFFL